MKIERWQAMYARTHNWLRAKSSKSKSPVPDLHQFNIT